MIFDMLDDAAVAARPPFDFAGFADAELGGVGWRKQGLLRVSNIMIF